MRPWFTLTVIAVIACCLVVFLFVVDFVLINRAMFETTFDVVVRVPFTTLAYTWEHVQFMYIIAVGVMSGVLIIALTTLILDTKRGLKIRGMRKELKRLQQALEEAQAALPKPDPEPRESPDKMAGETEKSIADTVDASLVSPDDISQTFDDAVQEEDFLEVAQKRREKELQVHGGQSPEGDIRARVTGIHASDTEGIETPEDARSEDTTGDAGSVVEESTEKASTESEDVREEVGAPLAQEDDEAVEERKGAILSDQQSTDPHDQVKVIEEAPNRSESSHEAVISVSEPKGSEKTARDSQVPEYDEESDKETSAESEVVEDQEQHKNARE